MRSSRHLRRALALALFGAALASPGAATAGAWSATPQLAMSAEYASNPQLRLDSQQSGYAAVLNLGLPVSWGDGARSVELAPRVRLAQAGGTSPIGADAYYVAGSIARNSERGGLQLSAGWADDSTAISEPASGTLTRRDVRRRATNANLDWNRALTPRLQTAASASWETVGYKVEPGAGLIDYRYGSVAGQVLRVLSERTQLQFTAGASYYQADRFDYAERSTFAQAGLSGQLTERWDYSLLYGASRAQSPGRADAHSGAVYRGTLAWRGLRATLTASVSQSYQPSGFGTLALTREQVLRSDWRYTERLSLFTAMRNVTTENSFRTFTLVDRSYRAATLGLLWAASPVWELTVASSWQQQQQRQLGRDASGTGTGLVLSVSRHFGQIRL